MEYLLKSDVMAALHNYGLGYARGSKAACAVNSCTEYTFPDSSLAVDGDLISRKDLRDKITKQYLENEIPIGWNASINALLRIIEAMPSISPAPSVDKPAPNRTDIDWQTKVTAAPLKLEAGKLYRTRDGRKAFVSIVKSDCNCVHGMVEEYYESITWCLDGRHYSDGKTAHIDLISLWDEPTPESGNSKLLEMIDGLKWQGFDELKPILRLLAERGDK